MDALLLTDLSCALPSDAWTDADAHVHRPIAPMPAGKWRVIDYITDHYAGRCLMTSRPDAATLTIPLHRSGWHAIALGMSERQWGQAVVQVRLTGESHWTLFRTADSDGGAGPVHEEPWRFADLTGKDLEIRFPPSLFPLAAAHRTIPTVCSLYSVRCTPVRPEHLAIVQQSRKRRMLYINDGFGLFYNAPEPSPRIVPDAIAAFADSEWDSCAFGTIGADLLNFPAPLGVLAGQSGWCNVRPGDDRVRDNLAALLAQGIDPLAQAIDQAHRQGHRISMYLRPQAYVADPPYDHILRSPFFSQHPQFRCVEANGKPISKLSLAFEPVRQNLNAVLAQALARGADGLTIAFVRGYPCVRYEQPVLDHFHALHHADARHLPDTDPRLRLVWAHFVTQWLAEVRALLDQAGPTPLAPRRELSVIVGQDLDWNMRFGFDVAAWARLGLIDAVLPYPYVRDKPLAVGEFVQAVKGTPVQVLPSLGTYAQPTNIASLRKLAHAYYQAGAHGLSKWDAYAYLCHLRLDDPELQALWTQHYMPPQQINMLEFAGLNLEAFGPMLGF